MSDELPHVLPTQHLTPDIFRKIHNVFAKGGLRKGQQQLDKLSPRGKEMFLDWWDENKDLLPPTDTGTDINALQSFSADVAEVINRHSMENPSGTPDFILGDLLTSVLASYNDAVQKRAEWRMESVDLPVVQKAIDKLTPPPSPADERAKSHFQKVLDDIIDEQASHRRSYIEFLMSNPGFIATFGEDFVIEYRDMNLSTEQSPQYNQLNEHRATFSQEVRFYRREIWEALQSAQKLDIATKIRNLRQELSMAQEAGNDEQVRHLNKEIDNRYDDLKDLGLRVDSNGNLESV